jgi:hypothetical protein
MKKVFIFGDFHSPQSEQIFNTIQQSDFFELAGWIVRDNVSQKTYRGLPIHSIQESAPQLNTVVLTSELDENQAFATLLDHGFLENVAFSFEDMMYRFGPIPMPIIVPNGKPVPSMQPKPVNKKPEEWMTETWKLLFEFNQTVPESDTLIFQKNTVLATVCSNNHLGQAIACVRSFLRYHPKATALIGLVDRRFSDAYNYPDEHDSRIHIIPVEQMEISDLAQMIFNYSQYELCTALKPFFMHYALDKWKADRVIFSDTDALFFGPLTEIEEPLDRYNFLVTPHIVTASRGRDLITEIIIMNGGTVNSGFVALNRCEKSIEFLEWWCERTRQHSTVESSWSLFGDQRWLDFLAGFDLGQSVFKNKAYNVAHWNLFERIITLRDGKFWINDTQRLKHFHFSMVNRRDPNFLFVTCASPEIEISKDLVVLINFYRFLVTQNYPFRHGIPEPEWAFLRFENGVAAPKIMRRLFNKLRGVRHLYPDPFSTSSPHNFFDWLNTPHSPEKRVTNFFRYLRDLDEFCIEYRNQPELQLAIDQLKKGNIEEIPMDFYKALAKPIENN